MVPCPFRETASKRWTTLSNYASRCNRNRPVRHGSRCKQILYPSSPYLDSPSIFSKRRYTSAKQCRLLFAKINRAAL